MRNLLTQKSPQWDLIAAVYHRQLGHRFAVFGVLSNAAALAILLVALVLSS